MGFAMSDQSVIADRRESVTREPLHRRQVDVQGYLRSDGLWEVEGRLLDTKSYSMRLTDRGLVPVGEALHRMSLTLVVDDSLQITEVRSVIQDSPYADCPGASEAYQALVGLRIKSGWMDRVKRQMGRSAQCTHLTEMLPVLATAAIQTIRGYAIHQNPDFNRDKQTQIENSCYGYREGGRAARKLWSDRS